MTLKEDWVNGEIVTPAILNGIADVVNAAVAVLEDAVLDSDLRMDDTRTPIDRSVTLEKLATALAAALTYLSGSGTVLRLGRNSDDSAQATQVEVWVDDDGSPSVRVARWNSSGEYLSGNLVVGGNTDAATRAVRVNAAAGQSRVVSFQSAGVDRWLILVSTDAESGSDAGATLSIRSRKDDGTAKAVLVEFNRQTGVMTLGGELATLASTTTRAGLNVPPGTAPTSPVNGDIWATAAGLFSRINGATGQLALTSDVATAVANLVNSSPAALDTLQELAAALGNDANYVTTVTNALALKAPLTGASMTSLEQKDPTDSSKKLKLGLSTVPTATTRVMMAPVSRPSQLVVQNTTTETDLITMTLESESLTLGATYRISLRGTIQVQATSGTLTFTPYLGSNAATPIVIPTQASAAGPVGFWLDLFITVRTTGVSGTYVAHGGGIWPNGGWYPLSAQTVTAATVDTTAASPTVKMTGKWATASSTNILKIETATIEQVV